MNDSDDDPLADAVAVADDPLLDDVTGDDDIDEFLAEMDDPLDDIDEFLTEMDDVTSKPYRVVERTEPCGKDECACTDDPDAEHGPYRYHVYRRDDGSERWEYQGPAYEV